MLKPGRGGGEDGTDADGEADAQRRLNALVQTAESMEQDAHMQPDQVAAAAWTDAGFEGRKRGRQESDMESSPDRWRRKSSHLPENPEWVHKTMEQYIALQMLTMVALACSFSLIRARSCSLVLFLPPPCDPRNASATVGNRGVQVPDLTSARKQGQQMQGEAAGGRRPSHEDGPGADGASRARGWHPSDPLPAPSTSSLLSRKTETGKNDAQDDGVEESEKADGMPAERTRVPSPILALKGRRNGPMHQSPAWTKERRSIGIWDSAVPPGMRAQGPSEALCGVPQGDAAAQQGQDEREDAARDVVTDVHRRPALEAKLEAASASLVALAHMQPDVSEVQLLASLRNPQASSSASASTSSSVVIPRLRDRSLL